MNPRMFKIRLGDTWRNSRTALHNFSAKRWPTEVDYILFSLGGDLPEYTAPPPGWQKWLPAGILSGPKGPTMSGLRNAFEQIGNSPRPVGVLVTLTDLNVGWATTQSLRDALNRLRAKGKKVVAYASHYGLLNYYIATAADVILAPKPAEWDVTGLRSELTFLKDSFAFLGVQAEVVNVSPYKTAGDTFARGDISPEHRAMIEWMMDGRFEVLLEAIAKARKLEPGQVRALIDKAPLTATAAQGAGLFDAVLYEDELAEYLGADHKEPEPGRFQMKWPFGKKETDEEKKPSKPKAILRRWGQVWAGLPRPIRWQSGKRVAIITLEGTIIPGRSPQTPPLPSLPIPLPFVGEPLAGNETLAQHFRDAEKDDNVAAVVFYVNSRGGSALASDLIWREMERTRRKKPVVVYMGDAAASGGYYVAATANHIVAQPMTITGSIGVISLKFVTAGLYEKIKANRVVIQRGANAGLYADDAPFTPELRAIAEAQTDAYYLDFKKVVMDGRKLEEAALEAVAGGRVWLGQQALTHKLVDELGDLTVAIEKAKALAKLPTDLWTPTIWYSGPGGSLLPNAFPMEAVAEYARVVQTMLRERAWMIVPFWIK